LLGSVLARVLHLQVSENAPQSAADETLRTQDAHGMLSHRMSKNVLISKSDRENNMSVLRRFRQKVNEWAGLRKVRSKRYHKRDLSTYVVKKNRLRAIEKKTARVRLFKLGHLDRV
jgi:hypothetical protein